MAKITSGSTVVLATSNQGKAKEIRELLAPYNVKVLSATDAGLSFPDETGTTFEENSRLKAESGTKQSGLICLADDSGLEVAVLGGIPGLFSARFADEKGGYEQAMSALYTQAKEKGDLRSNFTCALSVAFPNSDTLTFTGKVFGSLCWPPHFGSGFGYDPFFIPDGYDKPFGALPSEVKQKISHRHNALAKFITECL